MCERWITITNEKPHDIVRLTLYEQVPRSTDERIRVRVYQPALLEPETAAPIKKPEAAAAPQSSGAGGGDAAEASSKTNAGDEAQLVVEQEKEEVLVDEGARLNAVTNHLEWTLTLAPLEERQLCVKWGVERASGHETRRIDYAEDSAAAVGGAIV